MSNLLAYKIYDNFPLVENEIRLLLVHPGANPEDPLVCDLSVASLDDKSEYVAISYTWRGQSLDQTLLCNGVELPVTRACIDVLRRVRREEVQMFWIDVVCINQIDLPERSAQIPLIRRIYGQAVAVYAWLGNFELTPLKLEMTVSDSAATEPRELTVSDDLAGEVWQLITHLLDSRGADLTKADLECPPFPLKPAVWEILVNFLNGPYPTRRFIMQEITTNRDVRFLLHNDQLNIVELTALSFMLFHRAMKYVEVESWIPKGSNSIEEGVRFSAFVAGMSTLIGVAEDVGEDRSYSLLELLIQCRLGKLETTEELDLIYAIYSLASDQRFLPTPDYALDARRVFLQHAIYFIESGQGVETIQQAGLAMDPLYERDELPSWCPNWVNDPKDGSWSYNFYDKNSFGSAAASFFRVSGNTTPEIDIIDKDLNKLRIKGTLFDSIVQVVPCPPEDYQLSTTPPAEAWLRLKSYFIKCRDMVTEELTISHPPAASPTCVADLHTILNCPEEEGGLTASPPLRNVEFLLRAFFVQDDHIWTDPGGIFDLMMQRGFQTSRAGHEFAVTEQGYVGFVPRGTRQGDCVAILNGFVMPMMVRVTESKEEVQYQFTGCSYFLGLGKGEAVEMESFKPEGLIFV